MAAGSFFAELRRRSVIRAAILYIGAVWALAQGISQLGPSVGAPEWTTLWFLVAAAIGFPFWIAFAWFYEWTPEGFRREREVEAGESITRHTGRKLDFIFVGVMAVAIVLLLTDRLVLRRDVNQQPDAAISAKSNAVLPFVDMSRAKDQEYFSDGISEELLNLLAKISQLQVTARTSSFSFKGKEVPIPEIAKTLPVAHVLEGSIRLVEIPNENLFDKIHADPRWLKFLGKIGKAPEQLAKIEFKVTLPAAWQADAEAAKAAPRTEGKSP